MMNTKVSQINESSLQEAAKIIRQGGLVGFPTETVYGLGANALDETASAKIYSAKGRPSDNPLIAHISCIEELEPLVSEIPDQAILLASKYWPGPLTIIFPKSEKVPYGTTGGLDTVAIRMPEELVARQLIALAGVPIAAPSANASGRPSPTTANHVYQDMNGKIELILDGGPVGIGLESTIVDVSGEVPMLLRPGAITLAMLQETLGQVEVDPALQGPMSEDVKPKAPGMKYKHYAPKAQLTLIEGDSDSVVDKIQSLAEEKMKKGFRVGIICTEETKACYSNGVLRSVGERQKEETIAHNLFAVLREFDDLEVDYIYSESFSKDDLGQAIMNRLMKAAGYHTITV